MTFEYSSWRILIRVMLLLLCLMAMAFLIVNEIFIYLLFIAPVLIYQLYDLFRFLKKANEEISDFVESVHYRDFSRNFDVTRAPGDLKPLRKGFNEINSTFKIISKEKETQYLYLQKILEMVDTGILSYNILGGEVVWMNDPLKKMLNLPYLKTINSLEKRNKELYHDIVGLRPGEKQIVSIKLENLSVKILISATSFQTDGERFNLVIFQNVNEALDETESKAWQKLLSVLTHEIMNSVAPISSLADTLKNRMLDSKNKNVKDDSVSDDIELGIETIKRRSEGLMKFAETYRNLNKINSLNLQKILVRDLFENINQLMQPMLEEKKIEIEVLLKNTELQLNADISLIEQVIINLIVNSIEAVKNKTDGRIILTAYNSPMNKVIIKVSDNGTGMSDEIIEKIFVPFFTTRKNGSGIGLSFCKQIMMLHHGNIQVQSIEEKGTAFLLQF